MKIFKGIQVLLMGIILISCSGCKLFNWSDSDNNAQVTSSSDSVVLPTPEAISPIVFIPEERIPEEEGTNSNPVPEPMTMLLLGPALLGLYAMNKKKKNA